MRRIIISEKKKEKKESRSNSSNDEREWKEEWPIDSEEWMLFLLDFFLFLFWKTHYRSCSIFSGDFLCKRQSNTPKHRSPDFFRDEEGSGGVAAIEQLP
jgi:hypothetical protein